MKQTNNHSTVLQPVALINALRTAALSVSLCALPAIAFADWGAGIGLDNELMRYQGDDSDSTDIDLDALLTLKYQGDQVNLDNAVLSYEFINGDKYAVEAVATTKNRGFEADDLKIFKGLKERESSIDLGGRMIVETRMGSAVVDVTKDFNESKGIEASIKLGGIAPHASHWTGERKVTVAALGGLRYQSEKMVDYYYGVKGAEATATRNAYKGKSATTPFIGVEAQANFSKHLTFDGGLGVEKVANSIKNSSLTDDNDYHLTGNIGITYWF